MIPCMLHNARRSRQALLDLATLVAIGVILGVLFTAAAEPEAQYAQARAEARR